MNKYKWRKSVKDWYGRISVRKIIQWILLCTILVVSSVFGFSLYSEFVLKKSVQDIIQGEQILYHTFNEFTNSLYNAEYYGNFYIIRRNYSRAKEEFKKRIDTAINTINVYLSTLSSQKISGVFYFKRYFLDFKIVASQYRSYFLNMLDNLEILSAERQKRGKIYLNIDSSIAEIRTDISHRIIEPGTSAEERIYMKQALSNIAVLNLKLVSSNREADDLIDLILNGHGSEIKKDTDTLNTLFKELNSILKGIKLNTPEYSSNIDDIALLVRVVRTNIEKEKTIANRTNTLQQDVFDTRLIIEKQIASLSSIHSQEVAIQIRQMRQVMRRVAHGGIGTILFMALIMAIFFIVVRRRIVHPLSVFGQAIEHLKHGTEEPKIELRTNDEFGLLGRQFEKMARAVKERESKLIEKNRQIEQQHRELETFKRYIEDVIHASPNAIITLDHKGRIVFINKKAKEFMGEKGYHAGAKRLSELGCELQVYEGNIFQVIDTGEEQIICKEHIPPGGERVFNLYIYPLETTMGLGAVIEVEDITDQTELEEKMIESQKMETIGLLAGGFAHDFNNLLTGVVGYLELARMSNEIKSVHEYIDMVKGIIEEVSQLVNQILLFSRATPGRRKRVTLASILNTAITMIKGPLKEDVDVQMEIPNDCTVEVDVAQFTRAILNILLNSFEVLHGRGNRKIRVRAEKLSMEKANTNINKWVKVTIEDNGPGMSEEIKKRIFDPFFTTKTRGAIKGTGLGLAIVYRVIKSHGGWINVHSREGKGTQFEIFIPDELGEANKVDNITMKGFVHGEGTILLVDDEDMVRSLGSDILENLGYTVLELKNGRECLEFFDQNPENEKRVDLIIMDLIMPEMDGSTTLKELSQRGIRVPVLIASGYITLDMSYLKDYDYVKGMLRKPYTVEEIAHKVSRILKKT